ncbi:energy-coupling factor transporter ATPase [uncultured Ruminococcus sp.]|uniref:energy-coupling factor transporter ATPase n=1 Tax=uncultured Ruminococcus sp. TaxID=165186 RepID=UPI0015677133|nr:energy-coupling factor transporter ATPase [uncultured Ruminococcus sp.]
MSEIIRIENLHFRYGDSEKEVLRGIDLSVQQGEFVAVLGHNGSGKSTLAKHINAILLPTEGKVTVDGIDTADESRLYELRQTAGMVFQNPDNQIVSSVVEEDVAFALENLGVPYEEMRERVDEALRTVGMYDLRLHSPSQLSGGQKQRVAIAGVIAMQPKCLILDESTAMLDPKGRKEVLATVRRMNREYGMTVLLITHYMEEAAGCDRVVVMDGGGIIMDGKPEKVFSQVGRLKEAGLDVPQVTELAYELKKAGYDISPEIITGEECADALARLLGS